MPDLTDIRHMQYALRLGQRGLGNTWPNPSVGALVVKDGNILGVGTTARGGRPHAETLALAQAGEKAQGAALYVTLEPCAHQGKSPPCTHAIIKAGVTRVVAATGDPHGLVAGRGFAELRAAGIEVIESICEKEALMLNEGFFSVVTRKRPFVTLKLATSLDGRIATQNGESKWITGEQSRAKAHQLRATHDAVLTGIGTVLSDDPRLTCRLPGCEADSPQRVVLDSHLRIAMNAKILPAWIFTSEKAYKKEAAKVKALEEAGALVFSAAADDTGISLKQILERLAASGITRLLVEAGSKLAGALVRQDLVDRLYWFRAPVTIGDKGLAALEGVESASLASLPHFNLKKPQAMGADWLEIYECNNNAPAPAS